MPVRSSSSSVHRWPDRERVHAAAARWARRLAGRRPDVVAVGYIGSYARGDWGPGSDLDLVVILDAPRAGDDRDGQLAGPGRDRTTGIEASFLPVPADLLVYTAEEWRRMEREGRRLSRTARREAVWLTGGRAVGGGTGEEGQESPGRGGPHDVG